MVPTSVPLFVSCNGDNSRTVLPERLPCTPNSVMQCIDNLFCPDYIKRS